MKFLTLAGLGLLVAQLALGAPGEKTPTLDEAQRLKLVVLVQRIELAQLRATIIQREFDSARTELLALAKSLEVEGYELDVNTQTYRALPRPGNK